MARGNKGQAVSRQYRKVNDLTPSEAKIWELVEAGLEISEIAELLGLREVSVKTRLYTIREKLRA
jgi:DNA-binding NarL/FixJ family response regulator